MSDPDDYYYISYGESDGYSVDTAWIVSEIQKHYLCVDDSLSYVEDFYLLDKFENRGVVTLSIRKDCSSSVEACKEEIFYRVREGELVLLSKDEMEFISDYEMLSSRGREEVGDDTKKIYQNLVERKKAYYGDYTMDYELFKDKHRELLRR